MKTEVRIRPAGSRPGAGRGYRDVLTSREMGDLVRNGNILLRLKLGEVAKLANNPKRYSVFSSRPLGMRVMRVLQDRGPMCGEAAAMFSLAAK